MAQQELVAPTNSATGAGNGLHWMLNDTTGRNAAVSQSAHAQQDGPETHRPELSNRQTAKCWPSVSNPVVVQDRDAKFCPIGSDHALKQFYILSDGIPPLARSPSNPEEGHRAIQWTQATDAGSLQKVSTIPASQGHQFHPVRNPRSKTGTGPIRMQAFPATKESQRPCYSSPNSSFR